MFKSSLMLSVCSAFLAMTPAIVAQTAATPAGAATTASVPEGGMPKYVRPETPQQRKARIGSVEDPGLDPDPGKHFWRFNQSFHIGKFERKWAAYDVEEGFVRPFAQVNLPYEIYQQNDRFVWAWIPDIDVQQTPVAAPTYSTTKYDADTLKYFERERTEFTALATPPSDVTIHFKESSNGLPQTGSWRNALAVADMNGDGCPDLIAPPERKGPGVPAIFLGDCKGGWSQWREAKFPARLDYGSVVAADFNKDGKMDLAFGVHLQGVYVFLGDGKGNFTEVKAGLPKDFPTRRIVAADIDGDGAMDIVALSEGPTQGGMNPSYSSLLGVLNRNKGTKWETINMSSLQQKVGGDWLSTGNFNGDKIPDFLTASVYFGSMDIVHLSKGPKQWSTAPSDGEQIPWLSYFLSSATGRFTKSNVDDAIVASERFWPTDVDPSKVSKPEFMEVTGIDRFSFTKDGVKRDPIARWEGHVGVPGLAAGDFDGDGNLDIAYIQVVPRALVVLLGDGAGNFKRATVDGVSLQENPIYDLAVADVNKDGRPDIIMMYETASTTAFQERDGSIRVFLGTGATRDAKPAPATK